VTGVGDTAWRLPGKRGQSQLEQTSGFGRSFTKERGWAGPAAGSLPAQDARYRCARID